MKKYIKTTPPLPVTMRKHASERRYKKHKNALNKKPDLLSDKRLKQWNHWAIIEPYFPYDAIFKTHHMLIPLRVATEDMLNQDEINEKDQILKELSNDYDCYLVNFISKQSIGSHFHMHLLTYKDRRQDTRFIF